MSNNELAITARMDIKIDDFIAVAVNDVETKLEAKIKENVGLIRQLDKEMEATQTKTSEAITKFSKQRFETRAKKFVEAYADLNKAFDLKEALKELAYTGSINQSRDESGKVTEELVVAVQLRTRTMQFAPNEKVKLSDAPAIRALRTEYAELEKEKEALCKETTELKVALGNVPRLERKARAAACSVSLESTEGGQATLDKIKDWLFASDNTLKQLT